jgi:hypothetical protein
MRSLTLNPSPVGEGLAIARRIADVPAEFMPEARITYPKHNREIFERWYWMRTPVIAEGWTYLPVQWTAYYVNNGFGKRGIEELQAWLKTLDPSLKYYTIVQYDDGILNDLSHLDIKVFAMSGRRIDYPLPLIACAHKHRFAGEKRKYFMQFTGKNTHCRRKQRIRPLRLQSLPSRP